MKNYTVSVDRPPFWSFYLLRLRLSLRHPFSLLFLLFLPASAAYTLFGHINRGQLPSLKLSLTLLVVAIAPLLWTIATTVLQRRPDPYTEPPTTYSLSEDGLTIANRWYSLRLAWRLISRVRFTRTSLYLYVSSGEAHVIPLAVLSQVASIDEIKALLDSVKSEKQAYK